MIHIANKTYEVVVDHKNGWKPDAFKERYSEVLERYDYIVGDWGYNQLRLRGFFKEIHPKATKESSIATLQDYLNEYCNFGCAYFIIERIASKHQSGDQQNMATEDSLNELDEQEQSELEQQFQQELKQEYKQEQSQSHQPRPQRHQQRHQEQQNNRQQRPHRKPHHNSPKQQSGNNTK
ncbi:YutD family protein [Paenibacillus radicis (ex Xue et al. 2023)]|uniref:YutD family protein n=1 Tax=Paenibacillus radicis (ex Xue et al. 2023) TaxID=2972489 RepID=A0ABT1YI59_9BACL|nr:YutD family protein [Paenibacillus radicis (ex Xue et al. 2023)]MCR8632869.1 YutD family protein [Paenibacillus radicis (ex Xue et al. 2023)]